jgi:teichuronic acid biosynthesis glycosyltransferase TuaC
MQPQFMALMARAEGGCVITENVFENRFMFADELVRMGADIRIEGHHALVKGVETPVGRPVRCPDLRAGAALVLAGLVAEGETEVTDTFHHIERGYEGFVEKLRSEIVTAARSAEAIVCVGSRLARDCVAELGVDPARTLVIPNTYDVDRFVPITRSRDGSTLRLVTLGRLSFEKGHDVLLRAFRRVLDDGCEATLTLIGDGPERAALEKLAGELGVEERVAFTGTLLGPDVPVAFAEADAFVLPSRDEGFGVALIEAMATGLPVVATRSGGPEDIVSEEDGVLVSPCDPDELAEAILAISSRLHEYDGASIAGRTAERYSSEAVGGRLAQLYGEVLSGMPLSGTLAAQSAS